MLCSHCSERIKPVVAVDIDGTLADYHGHMWNFACDYFGKYGRPFKSYDIHLSDLGGWYEEVMDITREQYRAMKLAFRQGGLKRSMPIFIGAQALCWAIRDAGAELWITTARPYLSLDNIVPDTVEWLRRHEIEYDGMLFHEDKYKQLAERVDPQRVVAVFDDLPEMVDAANLYFPGCGWYVRGSWNGGISKTLMCDLDSAADIALNSIDTWKGIHDHK